MYSKQPAEWTTILEIRSRTIFSQMFCLPNIVIRRIARGINPLWGHIGLAACVYRLKKNIQKLVTLSCIYKYRMSRFPVFISTECLRFVFHHSYTISL